MAREGRTRRRGFRAVQTAEGDRNSFFVPNAVHPKFGTDLSLASSFVKKRVGPVGVEKYGRYICI